METAEDSATPKQGAVHDYHELIDDIERIQTRDGQISWPVLAAEEVTDLEPISVENNIESQVAGS